MTQEKALELTFTSMITCDLKFVSELDKPYEDFGNNPIWTLDGIQTLFGDRCAVVKENSDAYPIYKCKPLLHSMEKLTQPVLDGGLIPIVELAKLAYPSFDWVLPKNCKNAFSADLICEFYLHGNDFYFSN